MRAANAAPLARGQLPGALRALPQIAQELQRAHRPPLPLVPTHRTPCPTPYNYALRTTQYSLRNGNIHYAMHSAAFVECNRSCRRHPPPPPLPSSPFLSPVPPASRLCLLDAAAAATHRMFGAELRVVYVERHPLRSRSPRRVCVHLCAAFSDMRRLSLTSDAPLLTPDACLYSSTHHLPAALCRPARSFINARVSRTRQRDANCRRATPPVEQCHTLIQVHTQQMSWPA